MIKFENITKIYPPDNAALKNISLEIKDKEFVCIVGRCGAGKTTMLKLILAEERPDSGRIFFQEKNVSNIKRCYLPEFRRAIGIIFQDYKLLPSRNIYENIAYIMEVMGVRDEDIKRDVPQVLEIVGLSDKAENFPVQLSGGEKQRVAIARALIHRPKLIIADEPTGNLDPYHTQDIIKLLERINELGTTIILATHYKETVNGLKKRVITLEDGRIIRDEEKGRFII
ncbi:cell division ATP-binding protein FtsE [Candidatus Parcubacteria bacterium]|nr:cell division ATP-binding protein FtsE [Candidatus Parcubacteria bacterium]